MRPRSIIRFERFFLAALLLGLLNTVLTFPSTMVRLNANPIIEATRYPVTMMIAMLAISFGIQLLLWFFIARKASNAAKVILVVLTVLSIASKITTIGTLMTQDIVTLTGSFLITILKIIAIIHLFRPDAKVWLKSRGTRNIDPSVFR